MDTLDTATEDETYVEETDTTIIDDIYETTHDDESGDALASLYLSLDVIND